eukprot:tig00021569_g22351.t1
MHGQLQPQPVAQPFTLLLCRKARDAKGGPPEPAEATPRTGEYADRADLVLIASREYRLQAVAGSGSWAGASVRVRLAFAESAATAPEPLLRFRNGYKFGPPSDSVVLSFQGDGCTSDGFGFRPEIASYQLPRRPPTLFRLTVEALDGALIAFYTVHVTKRAPQRKGASTSSSSAQGRAQSEEPSLPLPSPRAKAPKRAAEQPVDMGPMRGGGGSGDSDSDDEARVAKIEREALTAGSDEHEHDMSDDPPAPPARARAPRRPPRTLRSSSRTRGPAGGVKTEAAEGEPPLPPPPADVDVTGLKGFEREEATGPAAAAAAAAAGPGLEDMDPDADDSDLFQVIPEPPSARSAATAAAARTPDIRPQIRSFARNSLAPPYRHGSDAAREEATIFFRAALAAVRSCAQAAGVKHPVTASDRPSTHVLRACEDLAAALSSAELFDTPLFSTLDGRFRARAALEDLRLIGSAALVNAVTAAWHKAILAATSASCAAKDDASLIAVHVWHLFEVCNGPWRCLRAPDLSPVDCDYMPHLAEDARLYVHATIWRARIAFSYHAWPDPSEAGAEAAAELYFEAWSTLIRAGLSPSGEEATILADLTYVLTLVPLKWELCGHFASKMYWFCGDSPDDAWGEAVAITNMGLEASLRGRARLATRHFARGAELISAMGEGARALLHNCHWLNSQSYFHIGDFRGALKASRLAAEVIHTTHGYSHQDNDIWGDSMRTTRAIHNALKQPGAQKIRPWTLEDLAGVIKWCLRVLHRTDISPKPRLAVCFDAHSFYRLGQTYYFLGKFEKALPWLEKAAAHYSVYPAYFPAEHGRMRRLAGLREACRAGVTFDPRSPGPALGLSPPQLQAAPEASGKAVTAPKAWVDRRGSVSSSDADQRPGADDGALFAVPAAAAAAAAADPPASRGARRPVPSWSVPAAHAL